MNSFQDKSQENIKICHFFWKYLNSSDTAFDTQLRWCVFELYKNLWGIDTPACLPPQLPPPPPPLPQPQPPNIPTHQHPPQPENTPPHPTKLADHIMIPLGTPKSDNTSKDIQVESRSTGSKRKQMEYRAFVSNEGRTVHIMIENSHIQPPQPKKKVFIHFIFFQLN